MANIDLTTEIANQIAETQMMMNEDVRLPPDMVRRYKCCLCKKNSVGFGNNPAPIKNKGQCCDSCNMRKVLPARFAGF